MLNRKNEYCRHAPEKGRVFPGCLARERVFDIRNAGDDGRFAACAFCLSLITSRIELPQKVERVLLDRKRDAIRSLDIR